MVPRANVELIVMFSMSLLLNTCSYINIVIIYHFLRYVFVFTCFSSCRGMAMRYFLKMLNDAHLASLEFFTRIYLDT